MLHLLDDSLEAFLRSAGPLPSSDVDVSFEPPNADWSAGLSRPAVNLYLWRLRRSVSDAAAGTELVEKNGTRYRRGPKPRMELGYLVTTWATDARNAHQLLGRVLNAFLTTQELPGQFLQGSLADIRPLPVLTLSKADDPPPSEFWVALGSRFQPGVELTVTATVDPEVLVETAPLPASIETVLTDTTQPVRTSRRHRAAGRVEGAGAAGAVVRTRRGSTVVDATGSFLVPGQPGDEVTVDTDPVQRSVVPPAGTVTFT
jgi:hypothetical protein